MVGPTGRCPGLHKFVYFLKRFEFFCGVYIVKQSGYSTAADEQNRVWGYTFNRNDAQGFKDYAKKAKAALDNVEQQKKKSNND